MSPDPELLQTTWLAGLDRGCSKVNHVHRRGSTHPFTGAATPQLTLGASEATSKPLRDLPAQHPPGLPIKENPSWALLENQDPGTKNKLEILVLSHSYLGTQASQNLYI